MRHFWRGPRYGRIPKAWIEHHSLLGFPRMGLSITLCRAQESLGLACTHHLHSSHTFCLDARSFVPLLTLCFAPFHYPPTASPYSMFPQRYHCSSSTWRYLCRHLWLWQTHIKKSKELSQVLKWTTKIRWGVWQCLLAVIVVLVVLAASLACYFFGHVDTTYNV